MNNTLNAKYTMNNLLWSINQALSEYLVSQVAVFE